MLSVEERYEAVRRLHRRADAGEVHLYQLVANAYRELGMLANADSCQLRADHYGRLLGEVRHETR